MPIHISVSGKVPQDNSCVLWFPLIDYDGITPVGVGAITTATLELRNHDNNLVIDSQSGIDVLANFDSEGNFEYLVAADYNKFQDPNEGRDEEIHVAIVTLAAQGQDHAITFKREFWITIVNQQHVTNA